MGAASRRRLEKHLARKEPHFREQFLPALRRCANGNWGLFGHNDHIVDQLPNRSRLLDPLIGELVELAYAIEDLRCQLGIEDSQSLSARYLYYRTLRGSHVEGEPKLARRFLFELESGDGEGGALTVNDCVELER